MEAKEQDFGEEYRASSGREEDCDCVNYYPGFLAERAEEIAAEEERLFEQNFFMGC